MNNRNEIVERIIEWLNVESIAYTLKENDSDRFRATIELNQNLNLDIQLTSQRPDCVTLLIHAYLEPDDQRAYSRLDWERKDSFLELSDGRCSISMWTTKSVPMLTLCNQYLSLRLFTLMD
jgi:hypothetical protein